MIPEDVRTFLRSEVASTWMLDILLLLKSSGPRAWTRNEIVAEIRGSEVIVRDNVSRLAALGVVRASDDYISYVAENAHDFVLEKLARIYAEQPLSVIKEVASAPNAKIQRFIDAFKLKR